MADQTPGIDELIEQDPYLASLGLHAFEGGEGGERIVVLPPLERHLAVPDARIVHGGVVAALVEATAMLHLRCSGQGAGAVRTVEFTTDFLRPVPLATTFAQAMTLRGGRRFASVRVEAWQEGRDRLVAAAMGRFALHNIS